MGCWPGFQASAGALGARIECPILPRRGSEAALAEWRGSSERVYPRSGDTTTYKVGTDCARLPYQVDWGASLRARTATLKASTHAQT